MKTAIDFNSWNPFRRPDWRLERVLQMADRSPDQHAGRSTRRDDTYVKGLRNFILRYRSRAGDDQARNTLAFENPSLYWAWLLYERRANNANRKVAMMEARILAGMSDEEVAEEMHTLPEAVAWYERLFFNVRDRLQAHDWVVDEVLVPAFLARNQAQDDDDAARDPAARAPVVPIADPFFDVTLKFFAYFGGRYVLDFALTGFTRGDESHSRAEVATWYDRYYKNRLRQRSGTAVGSFEINRYNVMQLFEVHNQIINIDKNTETEGEKETQFTKLVKTMVHGFTWAVGPQEGDEMVAGTPMADVDKAAAEPRDSELMLIGAGQRTAFDELRSLQMPQPQRSSGQEDLPHADAQ